MKKASLMCLVLLGVLSARCQYLAHTPPANGAFAIVGAQVFDGTGREPFAATVIVRGERVETIAPDAQVPADAQVVRADGQTLMPGLFDLHTHLAYATTNRVAADWPRNLQAYLYCGVTSVADFGTYGETFEPMRRLTSNGTVLAPRIALAARFSTPGGHGAEGGRGAIFTAEVLTPREARVAVKRLAETYKPDVLKVFTDGWRYGTGPDMTSMEENTLKALVEEAHAHGMKVLTHTVTLEKAKIAARAGVDVLAHGVGNSHADTELVALLKKSGTFYVSTLAVYELRGRDILTPLLDAVLDPNTQKAIRPPLTPPDGRPEESGEANAPRRLRWRNLTHNIKALHDAGVNLANGTDAGVAGTYHGWATLREIELAVNAGVPPLAALANATGNSARALGVEKERGTIAPGKLADLVLVDGAPHHNINDLHKISRVWLNGKEIDRAQLRGNLASSAPTALPAAPAPEKLDDLERADGRSQLDTRWIDTTDNGHDHSQVLFQRILRQPNNHTMSIQAQMGEKERPFVRLTLPLRRGAVEPSDVRRWRGARFDARGEGAYKLVVPMAGARDDAYFEAGFTAEAKWRTVKIEFKALKQELPQDTGPSDVVAWTGTNILALAFEMERPAHSQAWLELDNVRFYK